MRERGREREREKERRRVTKCQNLISKVSDDKMRGDPYHMIYKRTNKQTSKQKS